MLFFHRWLGVRLGGTETHVTALVTRLARKGHEIHVLTLDGPELKRVSPLVTAWTVSLSKGENVTSYGMKDPRLLLFGLIFALKSLSMLTILRLRRVDFDVISVHFVTEFLIMKLFQPIFRRPLVFVMEGYTVLEGRLARYADLQIAISKAIVDKCYANYGYKPIVIPAGIDENRFHPRNMERQFVAVEMPVNVLTVGRLVPEKNIDVFIKAAKLVCEKDKNIKFRIVGDGRERKSLEQLRDNLGLENTVEFLGRVSDAELPEAYRSADEFVLTQIAEDEFWIVAIEAMASGLPVIAPSASGKLEVLGGNGVVVPPKNPDVLAEKILWLAYNDQLRREIVDRGLKDATKFHWGTLVSEYERAYESATAIGRKRSSIKKPSFPCSIRIRNEKNACKKI